MKSLPEGGNRIQKRSESCSKPVAVLCDPELHPLAPVAHLPKLAVLSVYHVGAPVPQLPPHSVNRHGRPRGLKQNRPWVGAVRPPERCAPLGEAKVLGNLDGRGRCSRPTPRRTPQNPLLAICRERRIFPSIEIRL